MSTLQQTITPCVFEETVLHNALHTEGHFSNCYIYCINLSSKTLSEKSLDFSFLLYFTNKARMRISNYKPRKLIENC